MDKIFSKGLVLAFNAVPLEVDLSVFKFWESLSSQLKNQNMHLIVAGTTSLPAESFFTIPVHYHITDLYLEKRDIIESVHPDFIVPDEIIFSIATQYNIDLATSSKIANLAVVFYSELINAIKPAVILGWQSNDITSYIVRNIAMQKGLPYWTVERGLLKSTLMIDTGDNYAQSELLTSLTLERLYDNYLPDPCVWEALKAKALHPDNLTGKYLSATYKDAQAFRSEYNIPLESKVVAIFNHGPLGLAVKHENSQYRTNNRLDEQTLIDEIHNIMQQCIERKVYIVYQEHPLSAYEKTGVKIPNSPFIIKTEENIHTILNCADCYFFTHSTIQYEAVFYEKPIALLSRSILGYRGCTYTIDDYENTNDLLTALFFDEDKEVHFQRSKKWISFIYQFFLIKNDNENRTQECLRISKQLARYSNSVHPDTLSSLEIFIQRWC